MTERYLIPGSEWLFFKIYTGPKSADTLLAGPLRILVTSLLERAHVDSFFFIRYTDPEYHIRLRFHLPHRETGYGPVMCAACDTLRPLLTEGLVSSVVCDTYARELERYGEHTMEAVERYFHLDSRPVLELLHLLSADPPIRNSCAGAWPCGSWTICADHFFRNWQAGRICSAKWLSRTGKSSTSRAPHLRDS